MEVLAGNTTTEVLRVDPFTNFGHDQMGLNEADLQRARAIATTAVGLALWSSEPDESRLSILPEDVAEARRNRRLAVMAATGVAAFAGLLVVVGGSQYLAVNHARSQVRSAEAKATSSRGRSSSLEAKTSVHGRSPRGEPGGSVAEW